MFRGLKERLDLWAMRMGAATLPPSNPLPNQRDEAETILATPNYFAPPDECPAGLRIESASRIPFSGHQFDRFQFPSAVESKFPVNNTVHGWFVRSSKNWEGRPWVLLVHGWNAEFHYQNVLPRVALKLSKAGINAGAIALPFHSRRRPRVNGQSLNFISDHIPTMLSATRQSLADIHAFLLWAKAGEAPAAGLWGFSLGGWLSGLYACMTPAADAVALTTPVSEMSRAIGRLAFCGPVRDALALNPLNFDSLDLTARCPTLRPRNILLQQASYDMFVPEAEYQRLAQSWELKNHIREAEAHVSVLVSRKAMGRVVNWFAESLV